jgi:SAM-dependent methyltransferase
MTKLAERLLEKHFGDDVHPYRLFEDEVARRLSPNATLLDAGCGRTAPVLRKYLGRANRLIGVDVVEFENDLQGLELHRADLIDIPVESGSVDVVMARSVMEHVVEPERVYAEMFRILKPGGHFIFLTGNLWDYAALIARVIPNRFHPALVQKLEGRAPEDVFPVAYKTNTYGAVRRFAVDAGFEIVSFEYLGQYPAYFMFNGVLFWIATGYEKLLRRFESLRVLKGWILVTLRRSGDAAAGTNNPSS